MVMVFIITYYLELCKGYICRMWPRYLRMCHVLPRWEYGYKVWKLKRFTKPRRYLNAFWYISNDWPSSRLKKHLLPICSGLLLMRFGKMFTSKNFFFVKLEAFSTFHNSPNLPEFNARHIVWTLFWLANSCQTNLHASVVVLNPPIVTTLTYALLKWSAVTFGLPPTTSLALGRRLFWID